MTRPFALRATAPLLFGGTHRVRGGLIFADIATARELIASGRAKLDASADLALLLDEPAPCTTMPRPLRWAPR